MHEDDVGPQSADTIKLNFIRRRRLGHSHKWLININEAARSCFGLTKAKATQNRRLISSVPADACASGAWCAMRSTPWSQVTSRLSPTQHAPSAPVEGRNTDRYGTATANRAGYPRLVGRYCDLRLPVRDNGSSSAGDILEMS
jgi:hypothetical protein